MITASSPIGIAEMAARYDVSLRTLRFYEQQGLLQPRRRGNERQYSSADEVRLRLILKGKKLGFTINEIYQLIRDAARKEASDEVSDIYTALDSKKVGEQVTQLEKQRAQIDAAIAELRAAAETMRGREELVVAA